MIVLAIDPGNEQSAYVRYDTVSRKLASFAVLSNEVMIRMLRLDAAEAGHLAIEMIASYGMAVGREVFETCVWIGRFIEATKTGYTLVYRRQIKMHLCGNNTAKDSNIRQALIDRFGPGRDKAIGKKKTPGPLYGVANDAWSALAVAVTWADIAAVSKAA